MAKVTDLNGCFVKVRNEEEKNQIEGVIRKSKTRLMMNLKVEDFKTYDKIFFHTEGASKHRRCKEIYFHEGEFFDAPVVVSDIDPSSMAFDIGVANEIYFREGEFFDGVDVDPDKVKCTDRSIYEREAIGWSNGDECVYCGDEFIFVGKLPIITSQIKADCMIQNKGGAPILASVNDLSKPETEAEKKTRELAEEVNRICFELFGTPAFDCNQYIIDTVEKFIVNGYKKVD